METTFQIKLECSISVFATIMLTKKEDRATSITIVMEKVLAGIWMALPDFFILRSASLHLLSI